MLLRRSFHYEGFEISSESDIKSISDWLVISSPFTDHDENSREILESLQ